jgi:hypothetical protein
MTSILLDLRMSELFWSEDRLGMDTLVHVPSVTTCKRFSSDETCAIYSEVTISPVVQPQCISNSSLDATCLDYQVDQRKKNRSTGGYTTRYLVSDLSTGACAEEEALTGSSLSSGRTTTWNHVR